MKKIVGIILVAMALTSGIAADSLPSPQTPKQIKNSQEIVSFVDMAKVTPCPRYEQVTDYQHINSHDEVVFVKSTTKEVSAKTKTFKDGLAIVVSICSDSDGNLQLKINNTFYKTVKD